MLPARSLRRLLALTLLLGLLAPPACAFEDLDRLLPALPAQFPQSGLVFDYAAPQMPFADAIAQRRLALIGNDLALMEGLAHPEAAQRLTGIAFARVTALFGTGDPPDQITVLSGPPDMAAGAAAALKPRDFAESRHGETIVFARGDDGAIDFDRIKTEADDPFGERMGMSTRLGLAQGVVVRARRWDVFRAALDRFAGKAPCPLCAPVRGLLAGLAKAAGPGAALTEAFCVTDKVFLTDRMALDLLEKTRAAGAVDSDDLAKVYRERAGKPGFPPFSLALFAVTATGEAEAAHIALLYPDETTARRGAAEAALRLPKFAPSFERLGRPSVDSTVEGVAGGFVAVVSAGYKAGLWGAASQEYKLWNDAVFRRDLSVLQGAEMGPSLILKGQ